MLFCFCTTIIAGVLSKGATFIMVSQLAPDVPREVCSQKFNLPISGNSTFITLTETERVGWIWAVFFCFLAGELATFIRYTKTYRVSQNDIVYRKIAKPLIKCLFRGV